MYHTSAPWNHMCRLNSVTYVTFVPGPGCGDATDVHQHRESITSLEIWFKLYGSYIILFGYLLRNWGFVFSSPFSIKVMENQRRIAKFNCVFRTWLLICSWWLIEALGSGQQQCSLQYYDPVLRYWEWLGAILVSGGDLYFLDNWHIICPDEQHVQTNNIQFIPRFNSSRIGFIVWDYIVLKLSEWIICHGPKCHPIFHGRMNSKWW